MSPRPTPAQGVSEPDLVDGLVQMAFVTMAVLNRVGAEHDLSLTQMRVLGILRDRRVRITVLADYLGLEKSTLSGLVDRAERRGLVVRQPSPDDGRAVDVVLTRIGAATARRLYADIARSLGEITERLSATERQRLANLLDRMLAPTRPRS